MFKLLFFNGVIYKFFFINWAPIHYATLEGRRETVKLLIDKGADINKVVEGVNLFTFTIVEVFFNLFIESYFFFFFFLKFN